MKTGHIFRAACGILILTMVFAIASSAQSGGSVKGTVRASGRLLTSVWVSVSQNGVERGRSLTADDGKYYIGGLSSGVYDIVVIQGNRQLYRGQVNLSGDSSYDISIR